MHFSYLILLQTALLQFILQWCSSWFGCPHWCCFTEACISYLVKHCSVCDGWIELLAAIILRILPHCTALYQGIAEILVVVLKVKFRFIIVKLDVQGNIQERLYACQRFLLRRMPFLKNPTCQWNRYVSHLLLLRKAPKTDNKARVARLVYGLSKISHWSAI